MPSFSSRVQLTNAPTGSNIVLADVQRIKGAFKTYVSASTMNSTSVNYFSDKQILWVEDSGSLFQATVTPQIMKLHLKIQYHLNHLVILLVHLYLHHLMV